MQIDCPNCDHEVAPIAREGEHTYRCGNCRHMVLAITAQGLTTVTAYRSVIRGASYLDDRFDGEPNDGREKYETDDGGIVWLVVRDGEIVCGWYEDGDEITGNDLELNQHWFDGGQLQKVEPS